MPAAATAGLARRTKGATTSAYPKAGTAGDDSRGGSAYDVRRATCEIDAVFEPHGVVLEEARAVANELGLPRWWLNEQASAYRTRRDPGAP